MLNRTVLNCLYLMLFAVPAWLTAQPPAAATPIRHVVVIFQENVSFDHYFATYPAAANNTTGEPVFTAAPNTPTVNGLRGPLLASNPNSAQPVRLTRAQAVTCDQDHKYGDEQKAFNGGLMDKFVETLGVSSTSCDVAGLGKKVVMGYYDGNTITALWNYAQHFAMSDNSFATTFGPSTPGALNLIAGTTHGATLTSGSATGNISGGSVIADPRPSLALDDCTIVSQPQVTMSGKNVGDLLNAKGITWGWFQGGFAPSSRGVSGAAVCATTHRNIKGTSSADYVPHHQPFQYFPSTANPHHLPPTSLAAIGQTDQANHQYDLSDFYAGLSAGYLPAVSYLKAASYQDGHASNSDPLDEQTFLVNAINALMQSPFWSSTAIIINYDDSDGWYDHVMGPIVSQSSTGDDNLTGPGACGNGLGALYQGRCGYGPRLPLLVVSPYAKANFVDHSVSDQASILRFIEDNWTLGRIGDGSMDAIAGSLNEMFDFQNGGGTGALILDGDTGMPVSAGSSNATRPVTKAVAGPKDAITRVSPFQLDGSASTSFNGQPLTYQWTAAPGTRPVQIAGANTAKPSITFTSGLGAYSFILTVTDSAGNTSTDFITIVSMF